MELGIVKFRKRQRARNPQAKKGVGNMSASISENRMKTDVLIIGGGLAGCFAAIKAMEHGVNVTLLEKGHVAHSGCNAGGIDHFPYCYIPEVHGRLGYKVEDFV